MALHPENSQYGVLKSGHKWFATARAVAGATYVWDIFKRLFGSTTRVTRVSLTDMRNINNPALQAERFVLLSNKSNLFYQGHTGLRSRAVRCQ